MFFVQNLRYTLFCIYDQINYQIKNFLKAIRPIMLRKNKRNMHIFKE